MCRDGALGYIAPSDFSAIRLWYLPSGTLNNTTIEFYPMVI
jgi:hypothetical protein